MYFSVPNIGYPYISNRFIAASEITGNTAPILQNTLPMRTILPQADNDDIAVWIFELATLQKWENPQDYAELFKQNKINGRKIFLLKNEDLRDRMKIPKLGHRLKILQAIAKSWGNSSANSSANSSSQGYQPWDVESAPSGGDCPRSNNQFRSHGSDSVSCRRNSGYSWRKRNFGRQPGMKFRRRSRGRGPGTKKSSHNLRSSPPASMKTEDMQCVHSSSKIYQTEKQSTQLPANNARLQDGEELDISGMQKCRDSKIVEKPESEQNDFEPLSDSESCETKPSNNSSCSSVSPKNNRTPRASPKNPKIYIVKSCTSIQKGKKPNSKTVKDLEVGEKVLVNQLKRRRARIISKDTGMVIGWASTHDKSTQLLSPCHEET